MKYLFEYDDSDLQDLLGDLGSLGLETLQGWIIIWYGEYDLPRTEIIIAPSGKEALAIYLHRGYFAPDFQKMIKAKYKDATETDLTDFVKNEPNLKANFDLWFKMLVDKGIVRKFTAIHGLATKTEVKSPSYSVLEENPDPYHQTHIFETLFTNANKKFEEEKTTTRGKNDFHTTTFDDNQYVIDLWKDKKGWRI